VHYAFACNVNFIFIRRHYLHLSPFIDKAVDFLTGFFKKLCLSICVTQLLGITGFDSLPRRLRWLDTMRREWHSSNLMRRLQIGYNPRIMGAKRGSCCPLCACLSLFNYGTRDHDTRRVYFSVRRIWWRRLRCNLAQRCRHNYFRETELAKVMFGMISARSFSQTDQSVNAVAWPVFVSANKINEDAVV